MFLHARSMNAWPAGVSEQTHSRVWLQSNKPETGYYCSAHLALKLSTSCGGDDVTHCAACMQMRWGDCYRRKWARDGMNGGGQLTVCWQESCQERVHRVCSHFVLWLSLWDLYEAYIGISPYHTVAVDSAQCMVVLCHVWLGRVRKYKHCSFFVRYLKIQHMFTEQGVRLKAHTLFIERVLYFPISHSNEHRLHIFSHAV